MNIAITGSTGKIGKKVVSGLLEKKYNLICFSKVKKNPSIRSIKHDFTKKPLNKKIRNRADILIHLANQNNNKSKDILDNEKMILNLAKSFKKISKFIYFSSQMVYGNPGKININEKFRVNPNYSFYARSKINCEKILSDLATKENFTSISLRISGVIENKDNLIFKIKNKLKKNNDINIYGSKTLCRDYIFIDDLVSLLDQIIKKKFKTQKSYIFNFSSIQNYSIYQISKKMKKYLNSLSKIKIVKKKGLRNNFSMNINLLKKILRFKPEPFEKNLKIFLEKK